jgi:stage III sporulation protein AD
MDAFWKAIAAVLIAVIFGVFLQRQGKEAALLLTLTVCAMVAFLAVSYLDPVISFLEKLQALGGLDRGMVTVLLKAVGIGLISEICTAICSDSGNAALGKILQLLSAVMVLWLALPLLERLLDLLQKILEGI